MVQKLVKYGNSVAVVLPAELARALGLAAGAFVKVERDDAQVLIRPVAVVPLLGSRDRKFANNLYRKRKKVFKQLADR